MSPIPGWECARLPYSSCFTRLASLVSLEFIFICSALTMSMDISCGGPRCGEMLALLESVGRSETSPGEPVFMTICTRLVVVWGPKSWSFTFQWPYMYIISQRYFLDRSIFATIGYRKRSGVSTFAKRCSGIPHQDFKLPYPPLVSFG